MLFLESTVSHVNGSDCCFYELILLCVVCDWLVVVAVKIICRIGRKEVCCMDLGEVRLGS
jgi:hypothetical protein